MEKDDYQIVIEDQGFEIVFNPPGDGNCQFGALAHQLSLVGIYRSPETMREEIVRYLETNAVDKDGFPLLEMIPDNEFSSWNDYVEYMARNHTYGDQITLFAAANIFNIDVHIVSTLGIGAQHVFHPSSNSPLGSIYLGHFAENHGEHYVSLAPSLHDTEDRDNLVDSQSLDLGLDSNTARPTETDDCRGDTDKTTRLTEVDSSGNNNGEGPKGIDLNEVNDHNDDINDRSSGTYSNDNENTTAITDVGVDETTDRLTETGTPSINDDCNTCIALPTGTGFNDGYKPASPTRIHSNDFDDSGREIEHAGLDTGNNINGGGDHDDCIISDNYADVQPFLNYIVLEMIIKTALSAFPFMRTSMRAVSRFFKSTVDKVPCARVYIPELEAKTKVISVQKIIRLRGAGSGAVAAVREAVKSSQWNHAWLKLEPQPNGWFCITGIYWRKK